MRSNLCSLAGLLPLLLLAATLGSFGCDVPDETTGYRLGHPCKNHSRLETVLSSRRSIWVRKLSLRDSSLLRFAKRRPSPTSSKTANEQNSPAESIPSTAPSGPSGSPLASALVTPPGDDTSLGSSHNNTKVSPSQTPAADGYTYTPRGSPSCSCVIPMHAQFRLGIKLEQLFPLVSELATELADGLFLQTSQIRIVGANAVEPNQDETDVTVDFVPLDSEFGNTTAQLLASRLWSGQVPLDETIFGNYLVIFVRYPGLPPPPPSQIPGNNDSPLGPGNQLPSGVDPNSKHHKLSTGIILVIVLATAMGVLSFVCFVWLILLRRSLHKKSSSSVVSPLHAFFNPKPEGLIQLRMNAYFNSKPEGSLLSESMASSTISYPSNVENYTGTAKTFTLSEMERATDYFRPSNVIGEGGFGRVYQGVLDSGIEVAVKVLTRDDHQGGREFIAEVEMLGRLHHRNLVRLIGICTEQIRCLVYELITNGSVESHLHGLDKYTAPLNWEARVKIALGSARGLAYLHEDSQPRVIHRDFKGSNILLEDDYTPKVSDFGLAKSAAEGGKEHISTRVMGTFGYVAPEYAMTGHLLVKSDVYSYGVVLLELLSGRKPVDMSQPPGQENLVTWARPLLTSKDGIEQLADPYLGSNFPFDNFAKVAAIASMCVQPEVSNRPFMGEVVQALKLVCSELESSDVGSMRGTVSSHSDLLDTRNPQFLHDASFISIDYDSGPLESLDFEQRKPFSASAVVAGSERFFRQLSGSLRRYIASPPPKASSLPRGSWFGLEHPNPGSISDHRGPKYCDP
ncbi:receptor-like serine/threonine-protein kinase ALE2 isoform X2 [Physcomitrium patens]|uniref:Protein kinase domain-containing protein n=1 Tax=Physcomitrium patens TaxID=3218 RepID=A0A7I4BVG1_PHYPA|nr:receptor-like serine/threonine-protein kinase ALE2 isoform X2 [Physcomitrium patens]|eukprot:XP_024384793.1 receptor-like serine/threonine-protein kinase ALE2 isoform X2 [Physcomitrella patens]